MVPQAGADGAVSFSIVVAKFVEPANRSAGLAGIVPESAACIQTGGRIKISALLAGMQLEAHFGHLLSIEPGCRTVPQFETCAACDRADQRGVAVRSVLRGWPSGGRFSFLLGFSDSLACCYTSLQGTPGEKGVTSHTLNQVVRTQKTIKTS